MIQSTGMIRKVDKLGRVVLPAETRDLLDVREKDGLEILIDEENEQILLQKAVGRCLRCGAAEHLIKVKDGHYICGGCLKELQ